MTLPPFSNRREGEGSRYRRPTSAGSLALPLAGLKERRAPCRSLVQPRQRTSARRVPPANDSAPVRVGRGGLDAVLPRPGGYALAWVFPGVTLAAPADGVRMLVCPSSHRTRTRGGSSWSTSSITPARLGCATFSDSTTILSPA